MRWSTVVFGVSVLALLGAAPGDSRAAAAPQGQEPPAYVFPTGAGILFFHVRPEKTADFEAVAARVGAVLDQTQDPARKQQAAAWRMYKSAETAPDAAIYLFFFDPVVSGTDYDPVKLLGEAVPAEAQALYERLKGALIRVERMGLTKLR